MDKSEEEVSKAKQLESGKDENDSHLATFQWGVRRDFSGGSGGVSKRPGQRAAHLQYKQSAWIKDDYYHFAAESKA